MDLLAPFPLELRNGMLMHMDLLFLSLAFLQECLLPLLGTISPYSLRISVVSLHVL